MQLLEFNYSYDCYCGCCCCCWSVGLWEWDEGFLYTQDMPSQSFSLSYRTSWQIIMKSSSSCNTYNYYYDYHHFYLCWLAGWWSVVCCNLFTFVQQTNVGHFVTTNNRTHDDDLDTFIAAVAVDLPTITLLLLPLLLCLIINEWGDHLNWSHSRQGGR